MERLTEKRRGEWYIPLRQNEDNEWALLKILGTQYLCGDAADRLAAYEDTGLEPEEIVAAENLRHDCKIDCLLKQYNELSDLVKELGGIERLRELAKAEKDGRLAVLDKTKGDTHGQND